MATDYDAYFAGQRVKYPNATYPESECSALGSYLNGDTTANQCAIELTTYTNRRVPPESKFRICDLIIQLARDTTAAQADLLALIAAIRTIPASKDTGGLDWTSSTQSFNESFRGAYDTTWSQTVDAAPRSISGASQLSWQWTRINAFSARLLHADLMHDLPNGLRLIVATLETHDSTLATLELHLGAAAAWLEFAGREVRDGAGEVARYMDWAAESCVDLSGEVDGKRLAHWREKLEELGAREGLSEDVANACERAVGALETVLWEKKGKQKN